MVFKHSAKILFKTCVFYVICTYICYAQSSNKDYRYRDNFMKYRDRKFCGAHLFKCESGECVDEEKLCNGREDCRDGSDETRECINIVPCASKFLFQCDYGACIDKSMACDGTIDCKDGSDESKETCLNQCGKGRFQCSSGQCIDESRTCDGVADCEDNSDETVDLCSDINCPRTTYRCKYGACVKRTARCDGIKDCLDNSDEKECRAGTLPTVGPIVTPSPTISRSCRRSEFTCKSGQCIKEYKICDGHYDCDDHSDETPSLCSAVMCPSYTYRCKYGACINQNAKCNGIVECSDGSDEMDCMNAATVPTPMTTELPIIFNGCLFPKDPDRGKYGIANTEQKSYSQGDVVSAYSVLLTNCNWGYMPTPPDLQTSVCIDGLWKPYPQNCSKTCPPILEANAECKFNNRSLESCNDAVDGTIAIIPCKPVTEGTTFVHSVIKACKDGSWHPPVSECIPGVQPNNTVINIYYIFND